MRRLIKNVRIYISFFYYYNYNPSKIVHVIKHSIEILSFSG